tara:strand:- start:8918 stop:10240 length:1323 start_codon:yes stop_codon:yes gene_type:complete
MGILEDSLITLENGDKINIEDLKINDEVLSCNIDGLNNKTVNKEAIIWSEVNPKIEKAESKVTSKWKESVDKYMVINNKLKITLDTVILLKNFEGETTWGYSKSLRKGYFLFTDSFEYEEIKSIKRVKENVGSICLSVSMCSYYFVNGYLVHNTSLCDACDTCHYWPAILQHFGPHVHSSTSNPVSTTYGHGFKQNQLYSGSFPMLNHESLNSYYHNGSSWSLGSASGYHTVPWNIFKKYIRLYNPYNVEEEAGPPTRPSGNLYYYLFKWWDKSSGVPTSSNGLLEPGWKSYVGTDSTAGNQVRAYLEDEEYNCPHDLWYYSPFSGGGSTNKKLRLIYTGSSGVKWYYGIKSGSSVSWSSQQSPAPTPFTNSSYDLTVNETTHGGRGNSKVFIYLKIPVPPNTTTEVKYHLRWVEASNNNSYFDPNGWFSITSYRAGETI